MPPGELAEFGLSLRLVFLSLYLEEKIVWKGEESRKSLDSEFGSLIGGI